jgi:UrcA family protein
MRSSTPCTLAVIILAASAVLSDSISANAADPFNRPLSEPVGFGDLDLSKPPEVEELYKRVKRAARNVCRPYSSLHARYMRARCMDAAIARAVRDVGNVALTARHTAANAQRSRTERWKSAGVRP